MSVDEIRRIRSGLRPGEKPFGFGTVNLVGRCDGNAEDVVARCKDILRLVIPVDEKEWHSVDEWRKILPVWFVRSFAPERKEKPRAALDYEAWLKLSDDAKKGRARKTEKYNREAEWSLEAWLFWLHPSERPWRYWDCSAANPDEVNWFVEVDGWPNALGAPMQLLKVCGADEVVYEW